MNVAVIGTGRVGLVVGAGLADFGLTVSCVDSDTSKIATLQNGKLPFYEPGLHDLVNKNRAASRLKFTTDVAAAVHPCSVLFIAVGTEEISPGKPHLGPLFEVAGRIARSMEEYKVLVIKSTVPVGTASRLISELRRTTTVPFDVVSNPEFLRAGSAIENFMRPDRIILGGTSQRALSLVHEIYRPLYLIETPILITDHETAELIKYATNAFLAMKITFVNEVANLCDAVGADVHVIAKALGLDKRIGPKFLHPSPGFGGSCLPKDARTVVETSKEFGCRLHTVEATLAANQAIGGYLVSLLRQRLRGLAGRTICVLGLSYKPSTDDVRGSPAIDFIRLLLAEGAQVRAHDPVANLEAKKVLDQSKVSFFETPHTAAAGAHAIAVLTEWNEFRNLNLSELRAVMNGEILLDARNIYDPAAAAAHGFHYIGRGRKVGRANLQP